MRFWQLTYTEWDDQKATQRLKWTNYLWDAKKEFGKWSCIRAFQRKGNNMIYMGIFLYYAYIQMNTYLYLSAQLSMYLSQFIWWIWLMLLILWKLASSNTHRVGQQPRNPGDIFTWWPKAVCRQNSLCVGWGEDSVCVNLSLYFCFNLLAVPHGMCDLGSSTRDQTHAPYIVKTLRCLNHWTTREFSWSLLLKTDWLKPIHSWKIICFMQSLPI